MVQLVMIEIWTVAANYSTKTSNWCYVPLKTKDGYKGSDDGYVVTAYL